MRCTLENNFKDLRFETYLRVTFSIKASSEDTDLEVVFFFDSFSVLGSLRVLGERFLRSFGALGDVSS